MRIALTLPFLLLAASLAARRAVLGGVIKASNFRIFELENPLAAVAHAFEVYTLPGDPAFVRQILGRPGEIWGAEWLDARERRGCACGGVEAA